MDAFFMNCSVLQSKVLVVMLHFQKGKDEGGQEKQTQAVLLSDNKQGRRTV